MLFTQNFNANNQHKPVLYTATINPKTLYNYLNQRLGLAYKLHWQLMESIQFNALYYCQITANQNQKRKLRKRWSAFDSVPNLPDRRNSFILNPGNSPNELCTLLAAGFHTGTTGRAH